MTASHTVLLAGGPRLFRLAVAHALDDQADLAVLATVDDVSTADDTCARLRPAVAVIDAAQGAAPALEACAAIKSQGLRTAVLLTSEREDSDLLISGLDAGIDGFATREDTLPELLEAVRSLARGEARVPPRMLGLLLRSLIERRREEELVLRRMSTLTTREREVVSLMAEGMNRHAIARELVISPQTARTHIQRVLSKLGVHSQLEAAAMVAGYQSGSRSSLIGAGS